ncbi:GNAT family N-acetyltransferase [Legionella lytica]|uniref:GNAT family N-acetyltransferase n=1 Tax=Legionella lytica TaxID=96232 RepID=A0ABY4Y7M8_9GAMM|nr:GNAT family N-acetyltransferase [Legionella lytica]USQ13617.1 GNAT family N-acetyltransferase [Legionella lytica]
MMELPIKMRCANEADCSDLLCWRNDPLTRMMSRNQDLIEPTVHEKWYQRVLADSKSLLLIGELSSQSIGMVRFDGLQATKSWEVSIMLAPAHRNKGLSKHLLHAAIYHLRLLKNEQLFKENELINLIAEIKPDNAASKKLFENTGFKYISENTDMLKYFYSIAPLN